MWLSLIDQLATQEGYCYLDKVRDSVEIGKTLICLGSGRVKEECIKQKVVSLSWERERRNLSMEMRLGSNLESLCPFLI